MPFTQTIHLALAPLIGAAGIPQAGLDAALETVGKALQRLRSEAVMDRLPLLAMPGTTDDLIGMRSTAAKLDGHSDVVVLGTGGSSLGGQALAQLKDHAVPGLGRFARRPHLHFMDNLDPMTFGKLLDRLPLATTGFLVISKSGGTGETLMQAMAMLDAFDRAGLRGQVATHVHGISEPARPGKINALRALLEPEGVVFMEHHNGIGGRFSVLTNVGLLPAAVLGLDIGAIRAGAGQALAPVRSDRPAHEVPAALGAAVSLAAINAGKTVTVMMAYADRLERLTRWWVQLWAESIGKQGHGSQPVGALGPVDQHSQQQLYLAGPKDKLFTVVTCDVAGKGPVMDAALARRAGEADFAGRSIGDLVAAQGLAMIDTFASNGCPVRRIHVPTLDERAFGALLMHFMLETILAGYALGVDPFDQPAVEEAKLLAKRYLAEGRG